MKKVTGMLFVALLITSMLLLAGCGTPEEPVATEAPVTPAIQAPTDAPTEAPAAEEPAGKTHTIGLASFQQGNDWNLQVAQGAKEKIAELGWEVVHTDANADSNAQLAALEGFLTQKVDGVIVPGGMGPALQPAIDKLIEAGIPVVTIDLTIPNAVTNIYPDAYQATELLCVYALNKMQGQLGKYAHLGIPNSGWKAVDIRSELADKIFEIEDWTYTGMMNSGLADAVNISMTATRSVLLANPDLNLVYSSWGMPAVAAARAIREAGMTDTVFVVNTDADRIVLAEMAQDDSPISAVIGQKPLVMGAMAVEALQKAFNGDTNIPKITYAPFVVVTKNPELLPPGVETLDPVKAWEVLYPGIPYGKTD